MSTRIRPYETVDVPAVRRFNARLDQAQVGFTFPTQAVSADFPPGPERACVQEAYLAVDAEAEVRGGYLLKSEHFHGRAGRQEVGNYQLPLSEGIVEKRWAMVGVQLLMDAIRRNPRLYCLGMGGTQRPLPRMLARLGWSVDEVPFFFRVLDGQRFARELRAVGERGRGLLRLGAASGLAGAGAWAWNAAAKLRAPALEGRVAEYPIVFPREVEDPAFLDGLSCSSDRSSRALAEKFPARDERFTRLLLRAPSGKLEGWALLSFSRLRDHKQFGNLALGALVDGLALPGSEGRLVRAALDILRQLGAELVVSNQSHARWQAALRANGFLAGPSNFALARSAAFVAMGGTFETLHFNRGDGDGPINL